MSANSKTDLRTETVLVLPAAEVARKLNALNIPWLIDNPTDNAPNFFLVPEVKELLSLLGVSVSKFFHCPTARHTERRFYLSLGKCGFLSDQCGFLGTGRKLFSLISGDVVPWILKTLVSRGTWAVGDNSWSHIAGGGESR